MAHFYNTREVKRMGKTYKCEFHEALNMYDFKKKFHELKKSIKLSKLRKSNKFKNFPNKNTVKRNLIS